MKITLRLYDMSQHLGHLNWPIRVQKRFLYFWWKTIPGVAFSEEKEARQTWERAYGKDNIVWKPTE